MNDIEQIHDLATKLYEAKKTKAQYEDEIKNLNKYIKKVEETDLSNLLDEKGVCDMGLDDMDISKKLVFRCGYTKHTDKDAFKFLFDSNNDGALKKQLIVNLEDYPQAEFALMSEGVDYKIEYSIHHATLSSIIKELVEAGKFSTDDIEKYDVYVQPQIKVKMK